VTEMTSDVSVGLLTVITITCA